MRNLAISKPIPTQVHTASILLRQRFQHRDQSLLMLRVGQLLLWIGAKIEDSVRAVEVRLDAITFSSLPGSPPESQIVRDSKKPTLQIRSRAVPVQMPEQREEHVLNDIFAITDREAECADIAKQRISETVEE